MARGRNNRIDTTKTRELSFLRKGCLDFVDGGREMGHLSVELGHQIFQPVDAVEDFDALCMRIESDLEWPAHGGHLRREPRLMIKLVYTGYICQSLNLAHMVNSYKELKLTQTKERSKR